MVVNYLKKISEVETLRMESKTAGGRACGLK
jgi:hypothetical protein